MCVCESIAAQYDYVFPEGWQYTVLWFNGSRVEVGVNEETIYVAPYYYAAAQGSSDYRCNVVTSIKGYTDPNGGWIVKAPKVEGVKQRRRVSGPGGAAYDWNVASPGAFKGCTAMKKLVLPPTIKSIGMLAFSGCAIEELVCMAVTPPALQDGNIGMVCGTSFSEATIGKIVVPTGTLEAYKAADLWKDYTIVEGAEAYSNHQMAEHNGAWYEVINGEAALVNSDNITDGLIPETVSAYINGDWQTIPVKSIREYSVGKDITLGANIPEIPENWYNGGTLSFTDNHPTYRQFAPNVVTNKSGKIAYFIFKNAIVPHGVTTIANNALNHCSTAYLPTTLSFIGIQSTKATLYFTSEQPPSTAMTSYSGYKYVPADYVDNYKNGVFKASYTWYFPAGFEYFKDDKMTAYWNPNTKSAILKDYTVLPEDVGADGVITLPTTFNWCDNESCMIEEYDLVLYKSGDVENINKINIPEGMKRLKLQARSSIKELSLPSSLEQCYPLSEVDGLLVIKVAEGNPKFDSRDNCNALIETATNTLLIGCEGTVIPASVEHIADEAFYNIDGLEGTITIPANVKTIGERAFSGTKISKVVCSDGLETIGSEAFTNCYLLKDVTFGNSLKNLGASAFRSTALTSLTLPESIETIGDECFKELLSLKSVTFGSGLKSIGAEAFYSCSELTSVIIPNSVTSIGNRAFYGCYGLTSVTIGNGVTSIGDNAFNGCTGLTKVIVNDIAAWCGISFAKDTYNYYSTFSSNPLVYAHHLYSEENTEITDLMIPEGVTSIGQAAFYGCTGLTSVTIPNSVTSIGDYAFSGCDVLTSVTIHNGSIGMYTFSGCNALTSITIPNGSIEMYAFSGCNALTSITIGNSVTSIGDNAFNGCDGITTVTLNSNDIVSKTYTYSKNIKDIFGKQVTDYIIGDDVTSIGEYAFYNCTGLTSVIIGNSVTNIGRIAFSNCTGLTSIIIPNSVTSIGDFAFEDCTGLTSITIPNNVTSISYKAFNGCSGLTTVTIPNSVTIIDNYAFSGCI